MNIWQWLQRLQTELTDAGQEHSAQLIERLTDDVCEMEVERVEALLPEVKALCKTLENPWLEVFVRHWEMRNRLGNNGEGDTALPDAVSLFEFAHRADTIDCPQSICATQDLSSCYANLDGPGWVQERIDVCDETLARIDPSWGCYQCLSNEKAEALLDDGRREEALAYLSAQQDTLLAHGEDISDGMREVHHRILLALGRYEEALTRIEAQEKDVDGFEWRNIAMPRALQKAEALIGLERDEEALETLPTLADTNPGSRGQWLRATMPLLRRHPERNTWGLGRELGKALQHFSTLGAHRKVVEMALDCAELALSRDARWSAERHLRLARQHQASLRDPASVDHALSDAEARLAAHPRRRPMPVAPEGLCAWLSQQANDERNPENDIEWLLEAIAARPDDAPLREHAASALQACAAERDAIELLWDYVDTRIGTDKNPDDSAAHMLLSSLLSVGDRAGVERLSKRAETVAPKLSIWCRARLADTLSDWPSVERHCLALLVLANDANGARRMLANSLMQQRRFADAALRLREVCDANTEDRSSRWDYMTAASAAEDWAGVREVGKQLGMEIGGEDGPIDEDWGWVIVRYSEDGKTLDYYARRTSPVGATILENAPPAYAQHAGDRIVFDAAPLYPTPEDEEERRRFVPTFRAVHTLSVGGFGKSWVVDGPHPGGEAFDAFRDSIEARGWRLWIHSGEAYRLADRERDMAELPGIVFTLSAPESIPAAHIDSALGEACAAWEHRLTWLPLAEACGADTQPHSAAIERYGI
ncbi:MAG: hypothetical protein KA144_09220 [Xanthomonadaceae bacterium]|nr:hypothetical protein [Xanthomonadaceae bacterium]